ncbi:hypothetical protein [Halorussus salinus]|uniref:hypothetical protein n=1 Tax=Halorussus salinus TaxID=1364935 RepID=UPI00138F1ACE|nr:hypothetical protein [Halorussus salinus]
MDIHTEFVENINVFTILYIKVIKMDISGQKRSARDDAPSPNWHEYTNQDIKENIEESYREDYHG